MDRTVQQNSSSSGVKASREQISSDSNLVQQQHVDITALG